MRTARDRAELVIDKTPNLPTDIKLRADLQHLIEQQIIAAEIEERRKCEARKKK